MQEGRVGGVGGDVGRRGAGGTCVGGGGVGRRVQVEGVRVN